MSSRKKYLVLSIAGLSAVAALVSAYLAWSSWNLSAVAGCGGQSLVDCDQVLSSRWSRWLGMPVSFFGVLNYVGILICAALTATRFAAPAATGMLALSLAAAGAAAWFIGVQALVLSSFCPYCLVVHACGLSVGVLSMLALRDSTAGADYDQMRALLGVATASEPQSASASIGGASLWIATATSLVIVIALLGGQLLWAPPTMVMEQVVMEQVADVELATNQSPASELTADDDPAEELSFSVIEDQPTVDLSTSSPSLVNTPRRLSFLGLRKPLNLGDCVVLGSPDAKHVIVEMMDYTCKHCRHLHPHLRAAIDRYNEVAFVIYHTPLDRKCNPYVKHRNIVHRDACQYATLAMKVWKLAPNKFPEFHEWLLAGEKPPAISSARKFALKLAGDKVFTDQQLSAETSKQLGDHCSTLNALKSGLPILLTSRGVVRGVPRSESEWFQFLETHLELNQATE